MSDVKKHLEIVKHSRSHLSHQTDKAFWDKPWIEPDIQSLLFPPDKTQQNTYLLVDASLRSKISGVFDLDDVDVACRCLFKGDAAEDLKAVAPYLVDLTLPAEAWLDETLVPEFHKDFFARQWAAETGIIIQSKATMAQIWAHFRKFTKVRLPNGKVGYFRFWDPRILVIFLQACTETELNKFFLDDNDTIWAITHSKLLEQVTLSRATLMVN